MEPTTRSTDDQLLLRPAEAARRLGIGRTKLYELMATGEPSFGEDRRRPAVFRQLRWPEFVAALDAA